MRIEEIIEGNIKYDVIYEHGNRFWYVGNTLHRESGPAVEYESGGVQWWLDGKNYYTKNDYDVEIRKVKLKYLKNYV